MCLDGAQDGEVAAMGWGLLPAVRPLALPICLLLTRGLPIGWLLLVLTDRWPPGVISHIANCSWTLAADEVALGGANWLAAEGC